MSGLAIPSVLTRLNPRDMGLADAVFLRQRGLRLRGGSNVLDVLIGNAPVPMGGSVVMPALNRSVGVIVGPCAKLKVRWVHAWRVIASVHNDKAVRDRAFEKLVRVSVSPHRLSAGEQENSIAVSIFAAFPEPASIGFFNATFKNISRTKNRMLVNGSGSVQAGVARSAKLSCDRRFVWMTNAIQGAFRLISHLASPLVRHDMPLAWSGQVVI